MGGANLKLILNQVPAAARKGRGRPVEVAEPRLTPAAFYRALFDNPQIALFVIDVLADERFRFADANAGGEMFATIPWQEIPGHTPDECLVPDVAGSIDRNLRQCVASGKPHGYERIVDMPEGRRAWVTSMTPVADRGGRVRHVVGLTRMIPIEMHGVGAAEQNAALLESLRQAAPGLFYLFDLRERRYRFVAGQLSLPLGYKPHDLQEMDDPIARLHHPEDRAKLEAHFAKLTQLGDREIASFECRLRHREGHYLQFANRHMVFSRNPDNSVSLIFGIASDITDQQRMQEEVHGLSERLVTVALDERRRIARDLHDGTGQHIIAAEMALARIQTSSAREVRDSRESRALKQSLGEVMTSLREAESDIRILSYLMHPPDVLNWGLGTTISTYAGGFGRRAGLEVALRIDEGSDRLPQRVAVALLRACQEALTNVYRHARARKVSVELGLEGEVATLVICDDGIGVKNPERVLNSGAGVGLAGMRERMTKLGGTLELRSKDGTTIVATVPFERPP